MGTHEIVMVDLKTQHNRLKAEIDEAIAEVIESARFIKGPQVVNFERELSDYLGIKHVIACGNGTDALQIALMSLGPQPGDEVIIPDFTFIATAEVVALLGLKPVFVDVDPHSFTMDPESVRRKISNRTFAIMPVHLFGQAANMSLIKEIADEHKIHIIEDCAQAISADCYIADKKQKPGSFGAFGTTSFFPSKNLACFGDGGALYTNDDGLAEIARSIVNHGMKVRYHHDRIGVNSRLDTLQAAILNVKLKHLDSFNDSRRRAAAYYDAALHKIEGIKTPVRNAFSKHTFHQYTIVMDAGKRDVLKEFLADRGIPSMIYYPIPLHRQKAFDPGTYHDEDFPVSNRLSCEVLSLPMHTELQEDQLEYICQAIREFMES